MVAHFVFIQIIAKISTHSPSTVTEVERHKWRRNKAKWSGWKEEEECQRIFTGTCLNDNWKIDIVIRTRTHSHVRPRSEEEKKQGLEEIKEIIKK